MKIIDEYGRHKKRSVAMAAFVAEIRDEYPDREDLKRVHSDLANCASYLVFHQYYDSPDLELRLAKAHTCKKHLLCPFCARRRAAKSIKKNEERIEHAMAQNKRLKPIMITLTVKNGPDLAERNAHLEKGCKRLLERRRDYLKKKRGKTEFRKVAGAVYSYEFTNRGQGWHPHVHMIALVDSWIDQEALSREWQEITGDSFIVDVRRIKPNKKHGTLDITSGLLEVLKYAVKFHDLDLELNWHAYEVLKGKRLLGSFGVLRGIVEAENLLDDLYQDLPYLELYYRYSLRKGAYDLTHVRKIELDIVPVQLPEPSPDDYSQPSAIPPAHTPQVQVCQSVTYSHLISGEMPALLLDRQGDKAVLLLNGVIYNGAMARVSRPAAPKASNAGDDGEERAGAVAGAS
jgi:plasmid rolling circle replication initiator protein Rep